VETIGIRYTPEKGGPTDEILSFDDDDVHDAFARSDYVVLACPLTDLTRGMVGGRVSDTPAERGRRQRGSRRARRHRRPRFPLQTEGIRGAALDVTDPEPLPSDHVLWELENCLITPTPAVTPRNTGTGWPTSSRTTSRRWTRATS